MRMLYAWGWLPAAITAGTGIYNTISQRNANRQNLGLSREQYDYQKLLNSQQQSREDMSYQRKVTDLRQAGLNPALALGGGSPTSALSAGSLGSVDAPQHKSTVEQSILNAQMRRKNDIDISLADAQKELLEAQRDIAKHDARLITNSPFTSRERGNFLGVPTTALGRALNPAPRNAPPMRPADVIDVQRGRVFNPMNWARWLRLGYK